SASATLSPRQRDVPQVDKLLRIRVPERPWRAPLQQTAAAMSKAAEAPVGLRIAAITTLVSRTHLTLRVISSAMWSRYQIHQARRPARLDNMVTKRGHLATSRSLPRHEGRRSCQDVLTLD